MGQEELTDSVKVDTLSHASLNPILHGLFTSTMNVDSPNSSTLLDYKESLANNPFADKDLLVVGTNKQKSTKWKKLVTQTDHLFLCVHKKTPKHFIPRFNTISLLYLYHKKRGLGGWEEAQRQGEYADFSNL